MVGQIFTGNTAFLSGLSRIMNRCAVIALCAGFLAHTGAASANPAGGNVTSGSANISANGTTLTVTQNTNRAVIDWQSFDIAANETTNFVQPSASSMTLNRIGSQDPSKIYGTLTANGKIYLVNPNGFIFGQGANVNVGGVLATTAGIRNADFMKGRMNFSAAGNAGAQIVNHGMISARDAGLVGLVAPQVENNGVITANLGTVALASGDTLTMDMYGDNLVSVAVTNETAAHIAQNNGIIAADGGRIAITAAAGRTVANGVVSNAGILRANSFGTKNGKITLFAEGSNAVAGNIAANKGKKSGASAAYNSGIIEAAGTAAGETGGAVIVSADTVAILNGAMISTSGMAGGGDIRIGGAYLGGGDTPTAKNVYVSAGASIYNDAIDNGNGGRTTVWSDGTTAFYGSIYARGGANGGDGGFAETSGHEYLDAAGYVDLTAAKGEKGLYFLDPANIAIYGNVDPAFVSTDGSMNLASSLVLWLDPTDRASVTLTYDPVAATASGAAGGTTFTTSASIASSLVAGARIRIGGAGTAAAASTVGADTYTVVSVSGTTVTVAETLTATYTAGAVYRGLASAWRDKSGQANNASSTGNLMPLWVGGGVNGKDVLRFDGTSDYMTIADSNSLDNTNGLSIFAANTALALDGSSAAPILSKRVSNDDKQSYSLFYYTGNHINVDIDGTLTRVAGNATYVPDVTNIIGAVYDGTLAAASRVNIYNLGALDKTGSEVSATIPNYSSNLYIGAMDPARGAYLNGNYEDMMIYRSALSADARALVDQYLSAKWNVALNPAGTGATEGAKATSATGYSVFTTRYLERLSQTANVSLQATNNVTLDLKGDTMNFTTAGRSLSLTAGGNIAAVSAGSIATNNGAINMTAGGTINTALVSLNAGTAGVTLNSTGAMTLGNVTAGTITAAASGAASDVTISNGKTLTASGAGTAITLAAGRNFVNNSASSALATPAGRWLVYSGNPANDTRGGITSDFRRYSCTYGGSCPTPAATGNGFMYRYTPLLTATPDTVGLTYGDATPALSGYGYTLSGYLSGDTGDVVTGSLNGATNYSQFSGIGGYTLTHASGALASAMGYGFTYAGGAINVTPATLNIAVGALDKIYGIAHSFGSADYTVTGLHGSDSVSGVTLASAGAGATANVAHYVVTASAATGTGLDNYTITYTDGSLNVTPATLNVAARAIDKVYGDGYTLGAADYTVTGLTNTDSVTGVTLTSAGAAATANVANYSVTASAATGTGLGNYTITYTDGSINVTPATLTIAAGALAKIYGDTYNFGGGDYAVTGLRNGDSVSGVSLASAGAGATANVANYSVTAGSATGTGLGNYTINYVDGSLNVTPAALTIRANDANKAFGTLLAFNGTEFTANGLRNSDSVGHIDLRSYGRLQNTAEGNYRIEASNATGTGLGNYTVTYVDGNMRVTGSPVSAALQTHGNADYQPVADWQTNGGPRAIIEISELLAESLGISNDGRMIFSGN